MLGATNRDELRSAIMELYAARGAEVPAKASITRRLNKAIKEGVIGTTTADRLKIPMPRSRPGDEVLIVGPSAYPRIPDGVNEVLEILGVSARRDVDREAIIEEMTRELDAEIEKLVKKVDKHAKNVKGIKRKKASVSSSELIAEYNELSARIGDYEFWLQIDLTELRERLHDITGKLNQI